MISFNYHSPLIRYGGGKETTGASLWHNEQWKGHLAHCCQNGFLYSGRVILSSSTWRGARWVEAQSPPTFRADCRSVGTPEEQARAKRKRNHAFYHSKINSITCPVIGAFIIFRQKSRLLLDEQFESGFVENEN